MRFAINSGMSAHMRAVPQLKQCQRRQSEESLMDVLRMRCGCAILCVAESVDVDVRPKWESLLKRNKEFFILSSVVWIKASNWLRWALVPDFITITCESSISSPHLVITQSLFATIFPYIKSCLFYIDSLLYWSLSMCTRDVRSLFHWFS